MQTSLLFLFEMFGQMSPCNFFLIILFTSLTFYFPVTHSIYKLNFLPFLHRIYAAAAAATESWQEYTEELYKIDLNNPDNHNGVITHLEPDILEYEVKWALGSITRNET